MIYNKFYHFDLSIGKFMFICATHESKDYVFMSNDWYKFVGGWKMIAFNNKINKIIHDGHMFIAIGDNGFISTSSDGITWMNRNSGTKSNLNNIVYHKDNILHRIIIVGDDGTIIRSVDGIIWIKSFINTTAKLSNINYLDDEFILFTKDEIFTSDDGVVWKNISSSMNFKL